MSGRRVQPAADCQSASGMFVGMRVANPPQVDNLPHVRTALIHSVSAFLPRRLRGVLMIDTRRGFLLTAAAGAGAPLLLGMTNKSGSAKPICGSGAHTYEITHDWGELPANIKYGNTHGVCEDSQHRIYIHHTVNAASESHDSMVVFDEQGHFVKSWGKDFVGGAHGLHIHREGANEFLYLCDTKRGLMVKTTLDGEVIFTLGYPDESDAY